MQIFSNKEVTGHIVKMKATNPKHIGYREEISSDKKSIVGNFSKLLSRQLSNVNELVNNSDDMKRELAVNPRNVQIHDVMIAAQEAEMALGFLVSLRDRAVRAYQEIINMR